MQTESQQNQASDEIDLVKLFGKLIDHYKVITAITCSFILLAVCYLYVATPIYQADALLQVEAKKSGASALLGDMGSMFDSDSSATSEIEILNSRLVLGQTIEKLHLDITAKPKYFPIIGRLWAKITQSMPPKLEISQFNVPESTYNEQYRLIISDKSKGIYQLFDPNGQQVLQGEFGKTAHRDGISIKIDSSNASQGQKFSLIKHPLIEVVDKLKKELSIKERNKQTGILELSLKGPERQEIIAILDDISQNYFLQNVARNTEEAQKSLTFLEGHLPTIKQNLNQTEQSLNTYRAQHESVDLNLEAQAALTAIVKLEGQLNDLQFEESALSKKFTKAHPTYVALMDNRRTLQLEKERLNKQIQQLPSTQQEIIKLRRDAEVNQQLYVNLLNKMQELSIAKASSIGNVRIIDKAAASFKPVAPKKALILVLSALLGLMSACMFVLIRATLMAGIESPDEVEAAGLPVYATVPLSINQSNISTNRHQQAKQLLAASQPEDLAIEALRSLRTNLHFSTMQSQNQIITITGPSPGIGKSFISSNLAAVLAQGSKKVLLIDADMRKGYLHSAFGYNSKDVGLSNILSGEKTFAEVIKNTTVEGLDIICRGQTPPNPSELLMRPQLTQLLEWAKQNYDWILIDTPPILAVTDAAIPASMSGATLLVGRFSTTRVKEIQVAQGRLENSNIKVSGFIFNAMEKKASNHYNSHYHYNYQSDEKPKQA